MNKGLRISKLKKQKKLVKMQEIKDGQEDICCFVIAKVKEIKRINGKWRPAGQKTIQGLQIKNRIYLNDGKYKMVNRSSLRIKERIEGIPEWASEILVDKYNCYYEE